MLGIYFTKYTLNAFHLLFTYLLIINLIIPSFKVKANHNKVFIIGSIIGVIVFIMSINSTKVFENYSKPRRCAMKYINNKGYGTEKYSKLYVCQESDASRFKPIEIYVTERNRNYEVVREIDLVYFKEEIISFEGIDKISDQ